MALPRSLVEDVIDRGWAERHPLAAISRRAALTGGAAGVAAFALNACGGGSSPSTTVAKAGGGSSAGGIFGSSSKLKFVFVNHVTTNPFFVPTNYGAQDAGSLLGTTYQWTGSETSDISQMAD